MALSGQQVYALARQAGANHNEAIMLTAIAKGESSWNQRAHNPKPPDNSYGLWQINMLGQMGADRRKTFGIANNEQLWDPATNARAAIHILRTQGWRAWSVYSNNSYKNYMPEAMAASGDASSNWQAVAQSVGAGGVVTNAADGGQQMSPNGMPMLPPGATPDQIEDYIRENYPQAWGFLEIPELRDKLIEAAKNSWSVTKLQAEMAATKWWRTNAAAAREMFALKSTDPAQYKAVVDAKVAEITPELQSLGITINARFIAEVAIKYGWTNDQLRRNYAQHLTNASQKDGLKEDSVADVTADQIMAMARNEYFVPMDRQMAERLAIDVYAGRKTEEQVKAYLTRMASSRFPGLEDSGFSPGEYMAPIRTVIAETLEMQPADVDLLDRRYSAVLEHQGGDGKLRPMTVSEAQKWARSQDSYRTTKGAMDEASAFAEQLAKTFGKVAS